MNAKRAGAAARWINLVVPGGGLIVIGCTWTGIVVAMVFAAMANSAVAVSALFPDDYPAWVGGLCIGLAAGSYLGAQMRLAQTLRRRRRETELGFRRQVLAQVCECLVRGAAQEALEAIRPLAGEAAHDLLVAYRLAQVLTAKRDVRAAAEAWKRVRAIDRHHIYRHEVLKNERQLRALRGSDATEETTDAEQTNDA